jgi:tryptophan synthase beta chain
VKEKLDGKEIDIIGVEPEACPTLTKGPFRYDFGDTAQMTPLLKMFTLGHTFVPPGIHAGGLRYHGCAPLISLLVDQKIMRPVAYHQNEVFESAVLFSKVEGFLPAPETAHAVKAAIDEAVKAKAEKKEKCIVVLYSGHGHFDLAAYDSYLAGKLKDYAYPTKEIEKALKEVPEVCVGE